jgi:hypothetical protein
MTQTQEFARGLAHDPLGQLVALATKHAGQRMLLSSRSLLATGVHMLDTGESLYHARRSLLEVVALRAGTNHPDYQAAREMVRGMEEAEGAALGVAA